MLIKELVLEKDRILLACDPNEDDDDDDEVCNPVYCLPDHYGLCDPDMDEDGGCDPHYDNV